MRVTQPLGKKINVKIVITLLLFSSITLNSSFAERTYTVQNSDFLGKIVRKNYPGSTQTSKEQIMVAILRANPDAFRGGNIHFLKKVDSLILPGHAVIALIPRDEAARTIKEHYKLFKQKKTGNFPSIPLPKLADSQDSETKTSSSTTSGLDKKEDSTSALQSAETNAQESDNTTASTPETADSKILAPKDQPQSASPQNPALATQGKEDRISELERKKKEQDLILQQLDEKIENLEQTSSTDPVVEPEPTDNPTEHAEDTTQETTKAEAIEAGTDNDKSPLTPPAEEKSTANNTTADTDTHQASSFIERFLQDKRNLAYLLLPLLGLVGLLFWRRKKHLTAAPNSNTKAAHENSVTPQASQTPTGISSTHANSEESAAYSNNQENDAAIKIDMARAYQDMGYSDAAKEILEEVLIEGNDEQKEMAQALLAVF